LTPFKSRYEKQNPEIIPGFFIYILYEFTMTETIFETIKRLEDYLDRFWFKVEVILSGENEREKVIF